MSRHKCLCLVLYIILQIVNLTSCEGGSTLAFAIDDTDSMRDDINEVKTQAKALMNIVRSSKDTFIENMVLVTINDPESRLQINTTRAEEFIEYINNIEVDGGGDHAEMSLTGIEVALEASKQGSYVYVFTDASAKDYYKSNVIKNLCQKKQSQVIFVLTPHYIDAHSQKYRVYYDIAEACSGQVFRVHKSEVGSVLEVLKVLLRASTSVFKWTNVEPTLRPVPVLFNLDEKAEYALISASGIYVGLKITSTGIYNGPKPSQKKTMWKSHAKAIELINPKPGTYYAWVRGYSDVSVVVYGRTDFTFDYGFSILEPKSMNDATKQPIAGAKQHVSINVTDPDNSVKIKTLQILDINNDDAVITELPLRDTGNGFYITDPFVAPTHTFRIAVRGEIKRTGKQIVRNSKTNINPRFVDLTPQSAPVVDISEGPSVDVTYGADVLLTCNVRAHPRPDIQWYTAGGDHIRTQEFRVARILLPPLLGQASRKLRINSIAGFTPGVNSLCIGERFMSSEKSKPDYISYLKLSQVRRGDTYVCKVKNNLGDDYKLVHVKVKPVFKLDPRVAVSTSLGGDQKLLCGITSHLPITRRWFKAGKEIVQSKHHSISRDGSELTLKSVSVDMQGTYTCVATLNSDTSMRDTRTVEVLIPGLASPKIKPTNRNVIVKEGEKFSLDCSISQGYPKPKVQWEKVHPGGSTIPADIEVLTVDTSTFQHAGQYRCVVTNPLATDSATFNVTVAVAPKVAVSETNVTIPYNSDKLLVCKGEAYPPSTIQWENEHGQKFTPNQITGFSKYPFVSKLQLKNLKKSEVYACTVSYIDGIVKEEVSINVLSPLLKNPHASAKINPDFGDDTKVLCDITSDWPITRKWFKDGKEIVQSKYHSISRDGSELTLKSMSVDMQGTYTCVATLNSDTSVRDTRTVEVLIPGLAYPKIKPTNRNVIVKEGEKFSLDCSISQGYPKPKVQWQKVHPGGSTIPADTEVLTVDTSTFQHAGQYRCVVTNPLVTDSATFDVTVSGPPKMSVGETSRTIAYNSGVELSCKGDAYPAPTMQWRDEKGQVLLARIDKLSEYEFKSTMQLKNLRRSAVYTCMVSNNEGSVNEKVSITVLSPFEVHSHIEGATAILYGASQILQCDIKSKQDMSIRWYFMRTGAKSPRHNITSSETYEVSRDGTTLTIKSMGMNMDGQYTCEASLMSDPNEKVTYTTEVNVVGLRAPEISATHSMNRKYFEAICRVAGIPPPTISWQYKPKGSDVFKTISGSGEVLAMPNMKLSDSGMYKCIAKNILNETEHNFNVDVEEKPIITHTVRDHFSLVGDLVVKMICNVTGYPQPNIVWKKGKTVLTSDKKNVIKDDTLYINIPVISDTGEYICEATNKLGFDTATFALEVTDNFDVTADDDNNNYIGKIHEVIVEREKSEIIKCDLNDEKTESIRWYKDGYLTNQRGSIYTSEEGNYTCRANTKEGSTSETYVMYIGYPPIFDNDISQLTIIWEDSEQKLDCTADSHPTAKYEWFHNGKLMAAGYDLVQKRITDWGDYTCNVNNALGSIQRRFKVVTEGCFVTNTVGYPNQPLASDEKLPALKYLISNSGIKLKENEEIKFSCPSSTRTANSFKLDPNKKELIAKCITQDKFSVAGKTYQYSELQCEHRVEASVKATGEQCAGHNSEMVRVGFPVNGFLEAYNVCYDKQKNVPIYANTSSPALMMGSGADRTQLEWSSIPELGDHTTGDWKPAGACKCCYTKEALLDTNELPFGPAQAATYKNNLNSVPVWNPTCDGDDSRISWQSFNDELRDVSLMYDKVSTWTGASDYTYADGGLVPRYLWKVVSVDGQTGVVVYVNTRTPRASDMRCSTTCLPPVHTDTALYCCNLTEFRDNFHIPSDTFIAREI